MRFRPFDERDHEALHQLDLRILRQEDAQFDERPDREREGRIRTSLAALRFYQRSEHSFVADDGDVVAALFAQSIWQGDKPCVWISKILADSTQDHFSVWVSGLLKACIKSAFDTGIYEIHGCFNPIELEVAGPHGFGSQGTQAICHLGSRAHTALLRDVSDTEADAL